MEPVIKHEKGTIVNEKYLIEGFLGEGGLTYNYLARPVDVPRRLVTLKQTKRKQELTGEISEDRFQMEREYRLLMELSNSRIPGVDEIFELEGLLYSVREYREGRLLADVAEEGKKIPRWQLERYCRQLLTVLEYLHGKNIIYRDLKPSNIIIDEKDEVFLFDFGTARFYKEGQEKDTIALGTPGFAAPEQYGKSQTEKTADVYSFGALLYFLLTGDNPEDNPFEFRSPDNIYKKISEKDTADFLIKCLELDPKNRYQNVREVREALFSGKVFNEEFSPPPQKENSESLQFILFKKYADRRLGIAVLIAVVLWLPIFMALVTLNGNYLSFRGDDEYHSRRSMDLYNSGKFDKALIALNEAVSVNPKAARPLILRSALFMENEQYDSALRDLDRAAELSSDNAEVYYRRGRAYQSKGDYDSAMDDFNRVVKLEDWPMARLCRAEINMDREEYEKAIEDLDVVTKKMQLHVPARWKRDQAYLLAGRFNEIEEIFKKELAEAENDRYRAVALVRLGWSALIQDKQEKALDHFNKAYELDPKSKSAASSLALTLVLDKEYNKADEVLKKVPDKDATEEVYRLRAFIYRERNDDERADKMMAEAEKAGKDKFISGLVNVLKKKTKDDKVKEVLDKCMTVEKKD